MTVARAAGPSRAPSARPTSVARDILRKRAKPFKTEQSRILAKKKKMQIQTTYRTAPDGFTFLPLGTPDLSDRCKEVSRQKGLPILVVNAKPVSRHAVDPAKVSHYIHRIGYHFRSDVVEDACQELGYMFYSGRFVKEADLANINERSKMARAMAKHGIQARNLTEQETDDQVRAAIKEIFPRIPEDDLKEILRHAWEEGSKRVGTVAHMDLPRRVQLAVIARIRHTYTDYDALLRALGWKGARVEVEPVCLQKLIEWRGETNEGGDDDELEEVIRETIVIDDDDDDEPDVIHIDDEPETITIDDDSETEQRGSGYNSDTSLEISHRVAADEDLGAESHDERSRSFLERYQLRPRNAQQRDLDVRQKIGILRERLRNERMPLAQPEIIRVHVPESANDIIEIGGQQYRRAPSTTQVLPPSPLHFTQPPASPYAGVYASQPYPIPTMSADGRSAQDRPVASIEPQDDLRRVAMTSAAVQKNDLGRNKTRSRPATPESEIFDKRRRLDYPQQQQTHTRSWRFPAENMSQERTPAEYPAYHQGGSWADVRYAQPASNGSRTSPHGVSSMRGSPMVAHPASSPATYDPQKPLLQLEDYRERERTSTARVVPRSEQDYRYGFVDAQPSPIQYMAHPQQRQAQPPHSPHPSSGMPSPQYYQPGYAQPQMIYVQTPQTPLPVHGAPAAVQQVPRAVPPGGAGVYQQPAPQVHQPPPYHGAPAQPAQFFYPT